MSISLPWRHFHRSGFDGKGLPRLIFIGSIPNRYPPAVMREVRRNQKRGRPPAKVAAHVRKMHELWLKRRVSA